LALRSPAPSKTVINAHHGPGIEADQRVIVMAGRPQDLVAEASASVFWWSRASPSNRTWRGRWPGRCAIWRYRKRDAHGMAALGRAGADQYLSGFFDLHGTAA
jgi:hypothetical protein